MTGVFRAEEVRREVGLLMPELHFARLIPETLETRPRGTAAVRPLLQQQWQCYRHPASWWLNWANM